MDTTKLKNDREIREWMAKIDKGLRSDRHFKKQIKIEHGDSSLFFLPLAYMREDKLRLYIWTEHTSYFYFYKEDLKEIKIKATSESGKKKDKVTTVKEKTVIRNFFQNEETDGEDW